MSLSFACLTSEWIEKSGVWQGETQVSPLLLMTLVMGRADPGTRVLSAVKVLVTLSVELMWEPSRLGEAIRPQATNPPLVRSSVSTCCGVHAGRSQREELREGGAVPAWFILQSLLSEESPRVLWGGGRPGVPGFPTASSVVRKDTGQARSFPPHEPQGRVHSTCGFSPWSTVSWGVVSLCSAPSLSPRAWGGSSTGGQSTFCPCNLGVGQNNALSQFKFEKPLCALFLSLNYVWPSLTPLRSSNHLCLCGEASNMSMTTLLFSNPQGEIKGSASIPM